MGLDEYWSWEQIVRVVLIFLLGLFLLKRISSSVGCDSPANIAAKKWCTSN